MDLINIACYIGGCESIVIMVKKFDNDNEVSYGVMNLICKCFFFLANNDIYRERKKIRYRIVQVNIYNLAFQTAIKITL